MSRRLTFLTDLIRRKEDLDKVRKLILQYLNDDPSSPSVDTTKYPVFVKAPFAKDRHR